jgi:hypothetical protein
MKVTQSIHASRFNVLASLLAWQILVAGIAILTAASASADDQPGTATTPRIGWGGTYRLGAWSSFAIPFDAPEPGDYELRITAPDPDGHRVTFVSRQTLTAGRHTLRSYFKVGQLTRALEASIHRTENDEPAWSWKSPKVAAGPELLDPSVRLIITVGKLPGFEWDDFSVATNKRQTGTRIIPVTMAELPTQARAYDTVSALVLSSDAILAADQAAALRDWIRSGGRLIVTLPAELSDANRLLQPLGDWFPITLAEEPVTITEFAKLESFARKNVRIPFAGRMRIPGIKVKPEFSDGTRDDTLLISVPCGLGSVTVLALDLSKPPLNKWTELPAFGRRLVDTSDFLEVQTDAAAPIRAGQLSSTGITDVASQLHAVQEDFAGVRRTSPWFVMGLIVIFLVVVGPIDYVLVHLVFQRPRATWITLPIWVSLVALLAANMARSSNGSSERVNQLSIVNIDASSATCHQRTWTNLYSATTGRRDVEVRSKLSNEASPNETSAVAWSGIPEVAFGGMLREPGVSAGSTEYQLSNSSIHELPVIQWSTKSLQSEAHFDLEKQVDSNLQSQGIGQLSGTLSHQLPGVIEDWFLAYGNRVYRHKKTREDATSVPLAARVTLRIDQPNVYPRELRAFLTGTVATGTVKAGSQATDVGNQFKIYDSTSRDPVEVLTILTFHSAVGGSKYTGLTNAPLEVEDLSHLLKLGRAVLFGRLSGSASTVKMNGTEITPERDATFVRIVLPVKKIGNDIRRPLERFDVK